MWTLLGHLLGLDNLSGPWYGFWSGFGSDVGEVTIFAGLIAVYRRHNCHIRGCPRIGHHQVEGTEWVVCRRHHPDLPNQAPTAGTVAAAWQEAHDGR